MTLAEVDWNPVVANSYVFKREADRTSREPRVGEFPTLATSSQLTNSEHIKTSITCN